MLTPILPTVIGLVAYGIAWTTGLARFDLQPVGLVASLAGGASPVAVFVVVLALAATIGTIFTATCPPSLATAL